MKNIVGNT